MEEKDLSIEQNKMELEKKGRMADLSPEEARQKAKETVAKGVALGAGAIEGYVQQAEPKVVGEAARVAAKAVTNTVKAVKEEAHQGLPGEPVFRKSGFDASELSSEGPGLGERLGEKKEEFKGRLAEKKDEMKQEMKKHSPDEIREKARESVGRAVASGTGALEGLTQADPDLPAEAVKKVGETVREAGGAIREEAHKAKSRSEESTSDETMSGGI